MQMFNVGFGQTHKEIGTLFTVHPRILSISLPITAFAILLDQDITLGI